MLRDDGCLEVETEIAVAIRTQNSEAHQMYYPLGTLSTHSVRTPLACLI